MPRGLVTTEPTVGSASHAPGFLARRLWGVSGIGCQFEGMEHAAEADVVGHADRFSQTTDPCGYDAFDGRPGADAIHPYSLVFLELSLGHGF